MGRPKKYFTDEERRAGRRAARRAWEARNADKLKACRQARSEKINASHAAYRAAHPEKNKEWQARYRASNPERFRQSQREYKRKRYHSDEHYRLLMQLRSRLVKTLGRGAEVTAAIAQCGCTVAELRQHLESLFAPGMCWEQRSAWHIDHFYPLGAIDKNNRRHVLAACNWRNLRPVWAMHNWIKNDKVEPEAAALFATILSELPPEDLPDATEV